MPFKFSLCYNYQKTTKNSYVLFLHASARHIPISPYSGNFFEQIELNKSYKTTVYERSNYRAFTIYPNITLGFTLFLNKYTPFSTTSHHHCPCVHPLSHNLTQSVCSLWMNLSVVFLTFWSTHNVRILIRSSCFIYQLSLVHILIWKEHNDIHMHNLKHASKFSIGFRFHLKYFYLVKMYLCLLLVVVYVGMIK